MKKTIYNEEKAKMNPQFNENVVKIEIFHKEYNIDKKDNLDELPEEPAVFGIFAIIHEVPVHPRYVSSTDNLKKAVRDVFENPGSEGLKKFLQSPWIQMLCYELMPDSTEEDRKKKEEEWIKEYDPRVTEEGEYPEYKYVWPYDEVDE
jgi:translation elongation factor EF-1beta